MLRASRRFVFLCFGALPLELKAFTAVLQAVPEVVFCCFSGYKSPLLLLLVGVVACQGCVSV